MINVKQLTLSKFQVEAEQILEEAKTSKGNSELHDAKMKSQRGQQYQLGHLPNLEEIESGREDE